MRKTINERIIKYNHGTCLKWKYQLKKITISGEKILQLRKSAFFEKWF